MVSDIDEITLAIHHKYLHILILAPIMFTSFFNDLLIRRCSIFPVYSSHQDSSPHFFSSFQTCFSATMCTVFGILFMVASVLGEGEAWPPWFEQAIWKINNYFI
jgi:hypothetical protein